MSLLAGSRAGWERQQSCRCHGTLWHTHDSSGFDSAYDTRQPRASHSRCAFVQTRFTDAIRSSSGRVGSVLVLQRCIWWALHHAVSAQGRPVGPGSLPTELSSPMKQSAELWQTRARVPNMQSFRRACCLSCALALALLGPAGLQAHQGRLRTLTAPPSTTSFQKHRGACTPPKRQCTP